MKGWIKLSYILGFMTALSACSSPEQNESTEPQDKKPSIFQTETKAEVLPYLDIQQKNAKIALPFCEIKNCIDIDVQTVTTADVWLNDWLERRQAWVIQHQIGLNQNMRLQDAISAYVKKSDAWQAKQDGNLPYSLNMYTRIPYQRNQFVLVQVGLDTKQEGIEIKERYYFFVADRKAQKNLKMLDIIDAKKQVTMDKIVQAAYQKWRDEQDESLQNSVPEKLYWGQADWFFDQEGVGLHYRIHDISENSPQLDIYLTKQQTQQVLKNEIYNDMF